MRCCLLLCLTCLGLTAAEYVGVTFAATTAPGLVAVTPEDTEEPMRYLPVTRVVDAHMADAYEVDDKPVQIRHLAVRVETIDQYGQTKLDVYRVRVSDQAPAAVLRLLSPRG